MSLEVVAVKSGWFTDKVKFKAKKNCRYRVGTFFGDKIFFLNEGSTIVLTMSKNDMWEIGETTSLANLVTLNNQYKFPWDWA